MCVCDFHLCDVIFYVDIYECLVSGIAVLWLPYILASLIFSPTIIFIIKMNCLCMPEYPLM